MAVFFSLMILSFSPTSKSAEMTLSSDLALNLSVLAHLVYNSSPLIILSTLPHFSQKRFEKTNRLYCFLTKDFPNVKRVSCIQTRRSVIGNQFNLISVCDRISNMGEAINVNFFNVNISFPIVHCKNAFPEEFLTLLL